MSASRVAQRPGAVLALGAVLAASALATATAPGGPVVQAVVTYDAGVVRTAGVHVVSELAALGQAVVRGTPAALARLATARGVVGVHPDDRVVLAGSSYGTGRGVLASDGLGGRAGTAQAGRGVTVAVVDTGVSDSAALNRASGRLRDGFTTVGTTFTDGHGHGTFMASLVAGGAAAGSGNRAVGVAPGASVVVVKVAGSDGATSLSAVVSGLNWVAENAAQIDVANLSFSHERPSAGYGGDPLTHAVEQVRAAGVVPVVSAGNDPDVVGDPGFAPQALTVGAADLTADPAVAPFSGSAVVAGVRKPDLVASGVRVLGVLPAGSTVATEHPAAFAGGALWRGTGTSQATAITSGAAALFLQQHPSATPAQVKASLRAAADDLPGARDGAGLLDLTSRVVSGSDGQAYGGGGDLTGEGSFDASSWSASSWSASSWSASSWSASSWSASSWSASSWSSLWPAP